MSDIPELVDIHCHLVPGVDDGAPTLQHGLDALASFVDAGIRRVVTTPHLDGAHARSPRREAIDAAFEELAEAAAATVPDIQLELAYEVRIDDPEADLADQTLGLSGGGGLLVEFPQLTLPAYSDRMLEVVLAHDWIPVLAHPERYAGVGLAYGWIERWREMGAVMCLNVGSLLGEYGIDAERVARRMLTEGHADVVASDHHARPRRSTTLRRGWDLLTADGSMQTREAAHALMVGNPLSVLSGDALAPVPPMESGGRWFDRLRRRLLGDTK
ncbi:MAG: CpsB/CapC family capsule biosynthesis tyrosine phosphatase [Gemmatimonadota bacterium]